MLPQFVPLFYSDNFTVYAVEQIICKCAIFKTLYLLNSTCVFDMIFSDILMVPLMVPHIYSGMLRIAPRVLQFLHFLGGDPPIPPP